MPSTDVAVAFTGGKADRGVGGRRRGSDLNVSATRSLTRRCLAGGYASLSDVEFTRLERLITTDDDAPLGSLSCWSEARPDQLVKKIENLYRIVN